MAVIDQLITDQYALYNGDCVEVMKSMPDESIDMSIYSPPFCGLYNYSSSDRDLSNCKSYDEFFQHYEYVVADIARITKPGRMTAVHCIDTPNNGGANIGGVRDFPGDIIRLHEKHGFEYWTRRCIWKEPLAVRLRTMAKGLAHAQICEDSSLTTVANADYLIQFRKRGENKTPVAHPRGLTRYAGERIMPPEAAECEHWEGKQIENRFSHWIWRQYASCFWDDIRIGEVLKYKESRDKDDEKHVHPLQLDVIERACVLWTNPGEVVFTPFMGVGSEVYGAVKNGRRGIGAELKTTYYRQAIENLKTVNVESEVDNQGTLIGMEM